MARKEIETDTDYIPAYSANKEWERDIKFNRHWYHLKSIYDKQTFNFNQPLDDENDYDFDFNQILFEY